jgi:hypothetical protein
MSYLSDSAREVLNKLIRKWNMRRLVADNAPNILQRFRFHNSKGTPFFMIYIENGQLEGLYLYDPWVSVHEKNWKQVKPVLELFPFEEVKELLQRERGSDHDLIRVLQAGIFSSDLNAQQYLKEHLRKIEEHQRVAEASLSQEDGDFINIDLEIEQEETMRGPHQIPYICLEE